MVAEYFQALHQGETSIDHGGKLPGKNNNILTGNLGFEHLDIFKEIFWLFFDFSRGDPDFF